MNKCLGSRVKKITRRTRCYEKARIIELIAAVNSTCGTACTNIGIFYTYYKIYRTDDKRVATCPVNVHVQINVGKSGTAYTAPVLVKWLCR